MHGRSLLGRATIAASAAVLATALLAAAGQARTITLGSDLSGPFNFAACGAPCTLANLKVTSGNPVVGPNPVVSPVNGAIVSWRITGGSPGVPGYAIRVLRPTGASFTPVATGPVQAPVGSGLEVFKSNVPIQAGDIVGIETSAGAALPRSEKSTSQYVVWLPSLANGESRPFNNLIKEELAYNADIQPAPSVSLSSPASGSFKGGTAVTVFGAEFAAVTAVNFGSVPAPSFAVDSEGVLRAVAPAAAGRGTVPVTVTTIAGTTPVVAAAQFTYTACVVPKLKGRKLAVDRRALKRAGCGLGKINRPKGLGKSPKVVKQSAKPGTLLPPGGKVNVKLG